MFLCWGHVNWGWNNARNRVWRAFCDPYSSYIRCRTPPLTREAPGGDGGLLQRPPPALLTTDTFIPAQNTTTCTMRPLGKAAVAAWPPARPLTALARASTAAFGRVVGDAAPGRPTRLDSHPGGVRLGQKPGGNGCTAYSAGDRRTRLGRSAAVGSVETPAARPSPPSGTSLDAP